MLSDLFSAELIDSYLNNELAADKRQQFDKKLQEDPEFSEFFSLYQDVDKAIAQQDVIELRQELQRIHKVATEEWLAETPMLLTDPYEMEIERAIGEQDVILLRSLLNDIHDLHLEELNSIEHQPVPEPVLKENVSTISISAESESQEVDLLESDIYNAIMEEDVMNLRNRLQKIAEEARQVTKGKTLYHRFSRLTAVASIVLIMVLGGTLWMAMESQPMKPERVVEKYYDAPIYRASTRGGADKGANSLENAFELYREGDYIGAFGKFETIEEFAENKNDMPMLAHEGICLFKLKRYDEAADYFNRVIEEGENSYIEDARWFAAGCLLAINDDKAEAVAMYKKLAMEGHPRKEEINKILKKLKQ